jgi:hypothetical protein
VHDDLLLTIEGFVYVRCSEHPSLKDRERDSEISCFLVGVSTKMKNRSFTGTATHVWFAQLSRENCDSKDIKQLLKRRAADR